jgi:hypothetical protein
MMVHFLWTVKHQSIDARGGAGLSMPHASINLAWWLLLPIAWFGPFLPGLIQFEGKSVVIAAAAIALYFYLQRSWTMPSTQPLVFQPGDIYHLLKPVRLVNPILIKPDYRLSAHLRWPLRRTTKLPESDSLTAPGLLWLAVSAFLIISILVTS